MILPSHRLHITVFDDEYNNCPLVILIDTYIKQIFDDIVSTHYTRRCFSRFGSI